MSLVKSNAKSRTTASIGNSLLTPNVARALGNALAQAYKSYSTGSSQASEGNGSNRRSNNRRPRKSTQDSSGWSTYGSGGPSSFSIIRPVKAKRIRARFSGSTVLTNRAANVTNYSFPISYDYGATGALISYVNSSDASLLKGFTFYKLYTCTVRLSPCLGTAATGFVAVGYTESSDPALPITLTDVTNCPQNITGSAWNPVTLTLKPASKEVELYLNAPAVDINHRSAGTLRVYCSNGAAISTPSFVMDVILDMEVW